MSARLRRQYEGAPTGESPHSHFRLRYAPGILSGRKNLSHACDMETC